MDGKAEKWLKTRNVRMRSFGRPGTDERDRRRDKNRKDDKRSGRGTQIRRLW